jgi:hypothetical protein
MKVASTLALAATLVPGLAHALDVRGEVAARAWLFSAHGDVQDTDLDALGFDRAEGQPEFRVGAEIADRHHLNVSYLRIRREEEATATARILGILQVDDPVSVDISADYVRLHYGYSVLADSWLDLQPFLEIGVLRESSTVVDGLLGQRSEQDETIPFPIPGVAAQVAPGFPLHARAQVGGIATPQGHLIDVEGGAEAEVAHVFAGVGYRYADVSIDEGDEADVRLKGLYLEGGLRF